MFYMEPKPYWEPAEDCFIIHYTKTVVTAFGDDEGWDRGDWPQDRDRPTLQTVRPVCRKRISGNCENEWKGYSLRQG